jgi:hypothetical protein
MPLRRIARYALVLAVLIQAGFIAAYHRATDGCFCHITGFPDPPPQHEYAIRFIRTAALPLAQMSGPSAIYLPGASPQVASWTGALTYAGINGFFWFDGIFGVLAVLALLSRVRVGDKPEHRRLPRICLADPVLYRRRTVLVTGLVLAAVGLAAGATYRRWWEAKATRIAHAVIAAEWRGAALPAGVVMDDLSDDPFPADVAGAYVLQREPPRAGHHFLDTFVPPPEWSAEAQFSSGSRLWINVQREGSAWSVYLSGRTGEDDA